VFVSDNDDFDLIDDQRQPPKEKSKLLLGLMATLGLLLFGFAVGMAAMRVLPRLNAEPTETPSAVGVVIGIRTPEANEALGGDGSDSVELEGVEEAIIEAIAEEIGKTKVPPTEVLPTSTPRPLPTLTPTATPTVTPQQTPGICEVPVDPSFPLLSSRNQLGCAITPPGRIVWAAWEPFERGSMLWRSDTDQAYLFTNDGRWEPIDERWDGKPLTSRGAAPPGMVAPERGFGYVWGESDEIFSSLGWATDQEKGICIHVQDFEYGFVVLSSNAPGCTDDNLFNQATSSSWNTLILEAPNSNRVGASADDSIAVPPQPTPRPSPTLRPTPTLDPAQLNARPALNGSAFAARAGSLPLFDGNFSKWPDGGWHPLNAIVYDTGDYGGAADLSAVYQMAWSEEGLILAVRVSDDASSPGPVGTDMWQGDGLEIQFDQQLAADYSENAANDDDYQIGISFTPDFTAIHAYRWLPFTQEASLNLPGAVRSLGQGSTVRGYNLEVLLPWSVFGLEAGSFDVGSRFGFNLSINDNDSEAPTQEMTLSLSPARTTHDNPTEWSTLVLTP
jgi:hypothetical protein